MELTYYKSFRREGAVDVFQSNDPEYLRFEREGICEELINPYHGLDNDDFAKLKLNQKIMEVLKYLWLYDNRNTHRLKRIYEDPNDGWAKDLDAEQRRQVQLNLDHNSAAWKRLKLNRNGVLEDLWWAAKEAHLPKNNT